MRTALAYFNHGRWVVDCAEPGCYDARLVYEVHPGTITPTGRRLTEDTCARGHRFRIEMPDAETEAQIVAVLSERPIDADRGWYPRGHVRAILDGQPTGQTVQDLIAESREVAAFRAAEESHKADRMREALSSLGIEVRPDGSFSGSIPS